MASPVPLALLQVYRQANGKDILRINVHTSIRNGALKVSLKQSNDPSSLEVFLSFSLCDVSRTHRIHFPGATLIAEQFSYDNNSFKRSRLDVQIRLDPEAQLTPPMPNFTKANPTSSPLVCRTCQAVLADPRPDYSVEFEDSEALMESAAGCCRHHCAELHECDELSAIKRTVDPGPTPKYIEVDNGCPVVDETYLNSNTITLDGSKISCNSCKTVIGRKRGLTGQFEFELLLVDFDGNKIMSMFDSEFHYLSTRLLDPESHSYITVCDYDGNSHILTSLHSFRKTAIIEDTVDSEKTASMSLTCLYTMQSDLVQRNFGTKVYFPDSIIKRIKESFSESNIIGKAFNLDVGSWKFNIVTLT